MAGIGRAFLLLLGFTPRAQPALVVTATRGRNSGRYVLLNFLARPTFDLEIYKAATVLRVLLQPAMQQFPVTVAKTSD